MPYSAESAAAKWELFQPSTTKEMHADARGVVAEEGQDPDLGHLGQTGADLRDQVLARGRPGASKPASVSALQAEAME